METVIHYSSRYQDGKYEYRHVTLPLSIAKTLPEHPLLAEHEWRSLGVQQSRGWMHYAFWPNEKHILLFRRPLTTETQS